MIVHLRRQTLLCHPGAVVTRADSFAAGSTSPLGSFKHRQTTEHISQHRTAQVRDRSRETVVGKYTLQWSIYKEKGLLL